MDQTPDQLRQEVGDARGRLGEDLNELEYSVRSMTDWRAQVRRHPWAILAGLFATAVLFGLAIPRRAW